MKRAGYEQKLDVRMLDELLQDHLLNRIYACGTLQEHYEIERSLSEAVDYER